jgi:hypothetical protein
MRTEGPDQQAVHDMWGLVDEEWDYRTMADHFGPLSDNRVYQQRTPPSSSLVVPESWVDLFRYDGR